MPSCFLNILSHLLVRATLRQPTSKHTLTFTEITSLHSPSLPFLAETLICLINPLPVTAPHPIWHQVESFGGFWVAAVLTQACTASCGVAVLLLLCDKAGQKIKNAFKPLWFCMKQVYCDNMETHGCVRKKGFSVQICKETTRKVSVCAVHPTPGCAQTQQISIHPVLGCRLQGHVGSLYLSFICLPFLRDVLAPYFKALHGLAPEYATELFCPSQPVCSLSSSGRSLLRVPSPRVKTKGG